MLIGVTAALQNQRLQPVAKLVDRQAARDLPVPRERDFPALLGDDHGDRVGFLGQPDGGPMTGAEIPIELRTDGERQEARGRRDAGPRR